jgi:hypothetical protein
MHIKLWSGNVKERQNSEDISIDGKAILERISETLAGKVWTGCIWLMTGTSGGLLSTQ